MKIPLSEVQPGMILARAATNPRGQVLLKAGAEVQPKHLRIFQSWGVVDLEVEGRDGPADVPASEAAARIEARFRLAGDDPRLAELREALLERIAEDDA
jgi:hypothetical protein